MNKQINFTIVPTTRPMRSKPGANTQTSAPSRIRPST